MHSLVQRMYPAEGELSVAQIRPPFYRQPAFGGPVRPVFVLCVLAGAVICPSVMQGQSPAPSTDLDRFMATALQRRDIDRKTLSDYVLDEAELFEVLGPGRGAVPRLRRECPWYVPARSQHRRPLECGGLPIPE